MLEGKIIAITRSKDDAAGFIRLVKQDGATPIPLPTIELVSKGEKIVDEFLESIKQYNPDYSVFMSSKAVKLLFDTAKQVGKIESKMELAKQQGFSGSICTGCGSLRMKRNGSCEVCLDCGATSGCS